MCYNFYMTRTRKLICCGALLMILGQTAPVMAISDEQQRAIVKNCDSIREDLKKVQKNDAKARVYLGAYYEEILTNFITPLNVRLVENNLSSADLVENQNKLASTKTLFADDYVAYQQNLEELTLMDCQKEPEDFYEKLDKVRQKRKIVEQDVLKMRMLLSGHMQLANQLKGKL